MKARLRELVKRWHAHASTLNFLADSRATLDREHDVGRAISLHECANDLERAIRAEDAAQRRAKKRKAGAK